MRDILTKDNKVLTKDNKVLWINMDTPINYVCMGGGIDRAQLKYKYFQDYLPFSGQVNDSFMQVAHAHFTTDSQYLILYGYDYKNSVYKIWVYYSPGSLLQTAVINGSIFGGAIYVGIQNSGVHTAGDYLIQDFSVGNRVFLTIGILYTGAGDTDYKTIYVTFSINTDGTVDEVAYCDAPSIDVTIPGTATDRTIVLDSIAVQYTEYDSVFYLTGLVASSGFLPSLAVMATADLNLSTFNEYASCKNSAVKYGVTAYSNEYFTYIKSSLFYSVNQRVFKTGTNLFHDDATGYGGYPYEYYWVSPEIIPNYYINKTLFFVDSGGAYHHVGYDTFTSELIVFSDSTGLKERGVVLSDISILGIYYYELAGVGYIVVYTTGTKYYIYKFSDLSLYASGDVNSGYNTYSNIPIFSYLNSTIKNAVAYDTWDGTTILKIIGFDVETGP